MNSVSGRDKTLMGQPSNIVNLVSDLAEIPSFSIHNICINKKLSCRRKAARRVVETLKCSLEVTQDHWKMAPFESLRTVFYSHSIATMAVSLAMSTHHTNVTDTEPNVRQQERHYTASLRRAAKNSPNTLAADAPPLVSLTLPDPPVGQGKKGKIGEGTRGGRGWKWGEPSMRFASLASGGRTPLTFDPEQWPRPFRKHYYSVSICIIVLQLYNQWIIAT